MRCRRRCGMASWWRCARRSAGPPTRPRDEAMFTGLVETLGTVVAVRVAGPGRDLIVEAATFAGELVLGESVAINGVCLTVVAITPPTCTFQVGPETLRVTTLGELREGERVNLERSLRFGDRLG